ncbi:MAG: RagB/SusD family nutrient uptake outer membrane protein [Bacteroidales bacterium]
MVSHEQLPAQSQLDVYNFVVSELKACIPLLSKDVSTATYGRFTKYAAQTLLARVYLNAVTYTGSGKWAECEAYCDSVLNSNKYSLTANYKDSFVTNNESSPEIILPPGDETKAGGNINHMKTLDPLMRKVF